MRFIINRLTWLRGEGNDDSMLLRPTDMKMCCLGQIEKQCGLTDDELMKHPNPWDPVCIRDGSKRGDVPAPLLSMGQYELAGSMMQVNDDEKITDAEREAKLIELCAPHGIELQFIN